MGPPGIFERYFITEAESNELGISFSTLTWDSQAGDLTDEYTVHNDGLDLFFLLDIAPLSARRWRRGAAAKRGRCWNRSSRRTRGRFRYRKKLMGSER